MAGRSSAELASLLLADVLEVPPLRQRKHDIPELAAHFANAQELEEAVERKVGGQEVVLAPEEQPKGQIIDLMEALKAGLARREAATAEPGAEARAPLSDLERKPARRAPRAEEPAKARKKG